MDIDNINTKDNEAEIDGKYIILKKVEVGAINVSYLVLEKNSKKKYIVSINCFNNDKFPENIQFPEQLKKYQILSNLNNPYIHKIIYHGIGIIKIKEEKIEKEYIVADYIKGTNLEKFLYKTNGVDEIYAKSIFEKILKGVKTLHEAGICHRDLKPSNSLLDLNLNPIITDFIISPILKKDNKLDDVAGTFYYMSPQHIEGLYDGIKNDIFALGKTLFCMIFGMKNRCFIKNEKGDLKDDLIINKQFEEFWKIILENSDKSYSNVSEDFKNLFVRMVAYEENERPTIDEILKDKWFDELRD